MRYYCTHFLNYLLSFLAQLSFLAFTHDYLKSETGMLPQIKAIESCLRAHENDQKFGRVFTFSLSLSFSLFLSLANECALIRGRFLLKNDLSLNTRRSVIVKLCGKIAESTRFSYRITEYSDFRKSLTIFI